MMEISLFQDAITICVNHREATIHDMFEDKLLRNDIILAKIRARKYRTDIDGSQADGILLVISPK